jgi:hypothetical protein
VCYTRWCKSAETVSDYRTGAAYYWTHACVLAAGVYDAPSINSRSPLASLLPAPCRLRLVHHAAASSAAIDSRFMDRLPFHLSSKTIETSPAVTPAASNAIHSLRLLQISLIQHTASGMLAGMSCEQASGLLAALPPGMWLKVSYFEWCLLSLKRHMPCTPNQTCLG